MPVEHMETGGPQSFTSTKLDPPALPPGLVDRPDLLQRLVASQASLILIDAPAGWGKSSVLAAWSHSVDESRSFVSVRLGSEDDEPSAFWSYVVAAIYSSEETVPSEVAEALAASGTDSLRTLVPRLINNLNDSGRSIVLALDDYHQITDSAIHSSVEYLIVNAPRGFQVAIASRTDPPLPLARWRAAGSLEEVRLTDLQLSPSNTHELLTKRFGLDISQQNAALLCDRTEGWPAGIQLAGVSLARDTDPAEFITTFAGNDRNIADYLTTEVLHRQPEERSKFLQATSLLQGMTAELCNYVLETTDSAAVLEGIERENLFLVPLDSKREWFRYHHLFQEWLSNNLRINESAERIIELHSRAADWLQQHGAEEQAVDHLLAAGNTDAAAATIESFLSKVAFIHYGRVRKWLPEISQDVAAHYPRICMSHLARCLAHGDYKEARGWFATLDEALDAASDDERDFLRPYAGVYRGIYALHKLKLELAEEEFRSLVDDQTPRAQVPAEYARGLLGITLFWLDGPRDAVPYLREGSLYRRRLAMFDTSVTPFLAAAHAEMGEWELCESVIDEAFALPGMSFSRFPDTMPAHYAKARLLHHRGQLDEAVEEARRGLDQARAWVFPSFTAWGFLVLSDVTDDPAEKRRLLEEAERHSALYSSKHYLHRAIVQSRQTLDSKWPIIGADGAMFEALTRREMEVLRLFRSDLPLRDIGRELNITLNTAKGYAKSIYRKLAVSSRDEAVSVATKTGII